MLIINTMIRRLQATFLKSFIIDLIERVLKR